SEELLADVLFSVNSVMGQDIKNTWAVASTGGSSPTSVSLGQVRTLLREAFQVSPEELHGILQEVSRREAANVTLTLKVIEACDLRAKTVRGGSNPFVTIQIPGTSQSHRTRTEPETLSPKWIQEFKMHDLDQKVGHQVSAVKDLKSFSRLVKGTTALAQKHEAHLLGSVQILIKDIRENGINGWYPLYKESVTPEPKERGQIHIEAFVTAAEQGISPNEARKSLDGLIAKLIYHHIKAMSNNNTEEGSLQIPWHGQLTAEANAAIAQHAIILGIPPALQSLSWWLVGSRVPSSDAGWQIKHLRVVQNHLSKGVYDEGEEESLIASFIDWIDSSLLKLRNLKRNFPPNSGVLAKHQLSSLLSWTRLLEENLKGETVPENQIQKIVIITSEVHNFLCEIGTFYSPSLLKEMNIPYFREMYLLITHKLNPCVRPPLINVYNHLENYSEVSIQDNDEKKISTLTLEDGTNLWQLYMNMGRLYKLGLDLPAEVRKESGIHNYHEWFNKAVKRWVDLAKVKAELMIEKAVKLDDFEPIDEYNNFSTSATDVSGIFTDIQIWWQKLEWPDPENSMILMARILEDICSHGMKYSDLLKQKVEAMFSIQTHSDQLIISKQICTGLNNIERIRDELTRMPEKFNVRSLIGTVKNSQTGGEKASENFKTNINTLIEISSENMETKVTEFIEAVIEKMKSTLHHAVIQACDSSSENTLFTEVLEPSLKLLHKNLSDNNFRRFLYRLWEVLIELFHFNVTRNTDKRKASYFNGVYHILNASAKFFSPCEDVGLTKDETHSPEYVHLMELLECLRLSSENLISKYYFERYEEQRLLNSQSKGEVVVRAFFTKAGKLVVEVIMAKDMHLNNEVGSLTSKHGQFGSQNQHVDSYIKVQAMPSEWFPTVREMKTKTMRNSDPAVFEDTFEFELKNDDNGVSSGVLLLTVKDYCLGRSNKFIGECIIPLQELQCIDSSCKHTVPNIYLKVTQPGMECGYSSLRALRLRRGDKVAMNFLRKIQSRLPDTRHKSSGASTVSSDEDKPRSKSPRLLQKIIKS
ncbi:Protein unc-13-like protein D, partial [Armadillidium nasatum]